ncbi:VWA domain-containing protein, partial [Chloroflexota bacterium]
IVACAVADQMSGADYALTDAEEEQDAGELGDGHPDHSSETPHGDEEDSTSSAVLPQNSPSGSQSAIGGTPQQRTDDLFECVVERTDSKKDHIETAHGARAQGKASGRGGSGADSHLRTDLSEEALTETLMEMIDAQDRQWQKELDLRDLAVYYHLRGQKDGSSLNKMKQTQHGLKAIVEYLEEENLLSTAPDSESIMLTARAMDLLLEQVISKILSGKQIENLIGLGATRLSEHGRDTRRYRVGDVFKNISIRHTLKELARQRKTPVEIGRRDIRVFIREKERVQSDIVLCIDSSSSMGYHNKLLYARMAASGLAKSALAKGDRIGVVTFNNLGHEVISPVEDRQDIFERIISLAPGGNTNIGDGIKCAADLLMKERNHNQKFIVLITDGEATAVSADSYKRASRGVDSRVSERDILSQARKAAVKGIKTSVIHCTVAGADHQAFVKNIARMGSGRVIKVTSLDKLRELMA